MAKIDRLVWADGISFNSHGVRMGVRVNEPSVLNALQGRLPPAWRPVKSSVVSALYSVINGGAEANAPVRRYSLAYGGSHRIARDLDFNVILDGLENDMHWVVARAAPNRLFLKAGAVGWKGKAILVVGPNGSGISTLVKELVAEGATYYSDQFTVLDEDGYLYPYPKAITINNMTRERILPAERGYPVGKKRLQIESLVYTRYQPESNWRPRVISPGKAALALLERTISTQAIIDPRFPLSVLQRAVGRVHAIKSPRGEAHEIAGEILTCAGSL